MFCVLSVCCLTALHSNICQVANTRICTKSGTNTCNLCKMLIYVDLCGCCRAKIQDVVEDKGSKEEVWSSNVSRTFTKLMLFLKMTCFPIQ